MSREHLVLGPPGTGKTTFLQRQAILAIEKYGRRGVMISSLTRAAAEEIASRDTGIAPDRIGTLHAHAYRVLDRPTIAEAPEGLKAWNAYVSSNGLSGALKMDPGSGESDLEWKPAEARMRGIGLASGESLLQEVGIYRARMTPRELWSPMVSEFSDLWTAFKTENRVLDFTDLIDVALREVDLPPGEPDVMMVDEAQDLSRLEFELVRKWSATCEQTVTVGDPDQCLYGWRGTDPKSMTDHEFASKSTLSRSYRVPAAVHAYSLSWVERVDGREPIEYSPRLVDPEDESKGEAQGELVRVGHTWRRPEGLISLALADVEAGMTVMVLATCGYMLDPLVGQLKDRGVPFHNPFRPKHGGWNPMRGARRLLTYLSPDRETHGDDAHEWTWHEVYVWLSPMKAQGVLVRGAKTRVEKRASDDPDLQVGVDELADLFVSPTMFHRCLMLDVPWWQQSLLGKDMRIQRYPARIYGDRGGAALKESPRICVGTIHSVKGGQADSVYVFPDLSRAGWEDSWERRSRRAPTYRLFYVGFTRAREKLTLCQSVGDYSVTFPRTP